MHISASSDNNVLHQKRMVWFHCTHNHWPAHGANTLIKTFGKKVMPKLHEFYFYALLSELALPHHHKGGICEPSDCLGDWAREIALHRGVGYWILLFCSPRTHASALLSTTTYPNAFSLTIWLDKEYTAKSLLRCACRSIDNWKRTCNKLSSFSLSQLHGTTSESLLDSFSS